MNTSVGVTATAKTTQPPRLSHDAARAMTAAYTSRLHTRPRKSLASTGAPRRSPTASPSALGSRPRVVGSHGVTLVLRVETTSSSSSNRSLAWSMPSSERMDSQLGCQSSSLVPSG